MNNIREQQAKMVVAEEGATIQKDDFAVIDFAGSIDGKPFDGGEGKSYPYKSVPVASFLALKIN